MSVVLAALSGLSISLAPRGSTHSVPADIVSLAQTHLDAVSDMLVSPPSRSLPPEYRDAQHELDVYREIARMCRCGGQDVRVKLERDEETGMWERVEKIMRGKKGSDLERSVEEGKKLHQTRLAAGATSGYAQSSSASGSEIVPPSARPKHLTVSPPSPSSVADSITVVSSPSSPKKRKASHEPCSPKASASRSFSPSTRPTVKPRRQPKLIRDIVNLREERVDVMNPFSLPQQKRARHSLSQAYASLSSVPIGEETKNRDADIKFTQRSFGKAVAGSRTRGLVKISISVNYPLFYRRFPVSSYQTMAGSDLFSATLQKIQALGGRRNPDKVADPLDLFTPRVVRNNHGGSWGWDEALCPICVEEKERGGENESKWFSEADYQDHMIDYHGISPTSTKPLSPPVQFGLLSETWDPNEANNFSGRKEMRFEAKCHACKGWIALGESGEHAVWWRHAASCHDGNNLGGEGDFYEEDAVYALYASGSSKQLRADSKIVRATGSTTSGAAAGRSRIVDSVKGKARANVAGLDGESLNTRYPFSPTVKTGSHRAARTSSFSEPAFLSHLPHSTEFEPPPDGSTPLFPRMEQSHTLHTDMLVARTELVATADMPTDITVGQRHQRTARARAKAKTGGTEVIDVAHDNVHIVQTSISTPTPMPSQLIEQSDTLTTPHDDDALCNDTNDNHLQPIHWPPAPHNMEASECNIQTESHSDPSSSIAVPTRKPTSSAAVHKDNTSPLYAVAGEPSTTSLSPQVNPVLSGSIDQAVPTAVNSTTAADDARNNLINAYSAYLAQHLHQPQPVGTSATPSINPTFGPSAGLMNMPMTMPMHQGMFPFMLPDSTNPSSFNFPFWMSPFHMQSWLSMNMGAGMIPPPENYPGVYGGFNPFANGGQQQHDFRSDLFTSSESTTSTFEVTVAVPGMDGQPGLSTHTEVDPSPLEVDQGPSIYTEPEPSPCEVPIVANAETESVPSISSQPSTSIPQVHTGQPVSLEPDAPPEIAVEGTDMEVEAGLATFAPPDASSHEVAGVSTYMEVDPSPSTLTEPDASLHEGEPGRAIDATMLNDMTFDLAPTPICMEVASGPPAPTEPDLCQVMAGPSPITQPADASLCLAVVSANIALGAGPATPSQPMSLSPGASTIDTGHENVLRSSGSPQSTNLEVEVLSATATQCDTTISEVVVIATDIEVEAGSTTPTQSAESLLESVDISNAMASASESMVSAVEPMPVESPSQSHPPTAFHLHMPVPSEHISAHASEATTCSLDMPRTTEELFDNAPRAVTSPTQPEAFVHNEASPLTQPVSGSTDASMEPPSPFISLPLENSMKCPNLDGEGQYDTVLQESDLSELSADEDDIMKVIASFSKDSASTGSRKSARKKVAPTPISAFTTSASPKRNTQAEEVWCVCRKPAKGKMVACDWPSCEKEWFHLSCLKMKCPPKVETWFCSDCAAQSVRQGSL